MVDEEEPKRLVPKACGPCQENDHKTCQVANCGCGCVPSAQWMNYWMGQNDG